MGSSWVSWARVGFQGLVVYRGCTVVDSGCTVSDSDCVMVTSNSGGYVDVSHVVHVSVMVVSSSYHGVTMGDRGDIRTIIDSGNRSTVRVSNSIMTVSGHLSGGLVDGPCDVGHWEVIADSFGVASSGDEVTISSSTTAMLVLGIDFLVDGCSHLLHIFTVAHSISLALTTI